VDLTDLEVPVRYCGPNARLRDYWSLSRTVPTSTYVLDAVFVIVVLYVLIPSERRKYSVTDCPIFAEIVTLKLGPVT
jgi:hypothetical protein